MRTLFLAAAMLFVMTDCSSQASSDSKHPAAVVPDYPGAATDSSGVLLTGDSFDRVYRWYRRNLPLGSERSHTSAPIQSAVFVTGTQSSGEKSITLTLEGDKTMIIVSTFKS
ncbi:MAG TPA: hypothetical protein VGM99_01180 [Candidatus Cybelea sp.]|jgi:hypothetical protein